MDNKPALTIDEYIAGFPDNVRAILTKIRLIIKEIAPDATEAISYGMPTFKLKGNLVHFAGWKHHIGFYPAPSGTAAFDKELAHYKKAKGSIQFPLNETIPYDLIRQITQFRVDEVMNKSK
ncbi:hypothetical protein DGWBC_1244 [Dehalogenimonas sp. WBC-2]|nr:hypothetical protein DGWBC_1244 [Dehalogenimonas sp. WBC-2]